MSEGAPDYALPVHFQLPRERLIVQVWVAGQYERWAYAARQGDTWLIDSRVLPCEIPISEGLVTHWMDAPPEPRGVVTEPDWFDSAGNLVWDDVEAIAAPRKELPK